MFDTLTEDEKKAVINAEIFDPFSILGIHKIKINDVDVIVVRTFQPEAKEVFILGSKSSEKSVRVHPEGIFEAVFKDIKDFFPYRIKVLWKDSNQSIIDDPYRLPPVINDYDLYLFNEGTHKKIYERFVVQPMVFESLEGVFFSIWAPNAIRVSVVGNFNLWDGRRHMMRSRGNSGVWEIFIPGLQVNLLYKFEIVTREKVITVRSDPTGFMFEERPKTASIVFNQNKYKWNDDNWIKNRTLPIDKPVAIYELHLGSWRKKITDGKEHFLTYREISDYLIPYLKKTGFNYVELLPVAEHPLDDSWGYQVTGYFAPTSRFGNPDDLKYLIDQLHQAGIGVLMDWVPAHFPKDIYALAKLDGTSLYEHIDPKKGEHTEWGTLIFNYGRSEVKSFLISNALFWLDKYHFDGLRVDAVASMLYLDYSREEGQWIPNKYGGNENIEAINFIRELNEAIFKEYPATLMIAEESTSWSMVSRPTYIGGLGFSFKWNMGWMNDFLEYISKAPIHKKHHTNNLTFSLLYAFNENFILPISHDEVVHGKGSLISKMPGDYWQKFANTRLALGYMFAHPGKKLLFMGSEFGQWEEWNFRKSLDWNLLEFPPHKQLLKYTSDLVKIYKSEKALWEDDFTFEGFSWIDFHDSDSSTVSFIRWSKEKKEHIIIICNFTPVIRNNYRIGVPDECVYREIMNSDSGFYYGSNTGNYGSVRSERISWHMYPCSLELTLPPLSVLYLKPEYKEKNK